MYEILEFNENHALDTRTDFPVGNSGSENCHSASVWFTRFSEKCGASCPTEDQIVMEIDSIASDLHLATPLKNWIHSQYNALVLHPNHAQNCLKAAPQRLRHSTGNELLRRALAVEGRTLPNLLRGLPAASERQASWMFTSRCQCRHQRRRPTRRSHAGGVAWRSG